MDRLLPAVTMIGASLRQFLVRVEVVDQRARFTEGWAAFVEAEKIVRGDVGFFVIDAPNTLLLTVYGPTGQIKNMEDRPTVWNLDIANGYEQVQNQRYHLVRRGVQRPLNFGGEHTDQTNEYILVPITSC
jgi:hypothetical protein